MDLLLRLVLSFSIALSGLPAWGAVTTTEFKGEEYAKHCEGMLEAIKNGEIDAYLLGQAETDAERAQVLFDYRLIFNEQFNKAVMAAVNKRGIRAGDTHKSLRKYVKDIAALAKMPEQEFAAFTQEVLDQLKAISAAADTGNAHASHVAYLRTSRILEAIAKSPQRAEVMRVMGTAVRIALLATLKAGLVNAAQGSPLPSVNKIMIGGLILGVAVTLLLFGAMPEHIPARRATRYWEDPVAAHTEWHFFWNLLMTLGGGMGGVVSSLVGGFGIEVGAGFHFNHRAGKVEFAQTVQTARKTDIAVKDLFENYEDDADNGVLSVIKVCDKDICQLNPVELAYLGHLDILEIKALTDAMTGDVRPTTIVKVIDSAQSMAKELADNPESYRAHMRFMGTINDLSKRFTLDTEKRSEAMENLNGRIAKTSEVIRDLKERPYSYDFADLNEERLLKNEMLIQKLNSDLGTLEAMVFDQAAFDKYVETIKPFIQELKDLLNPRPQTPGQWKNAAENSILVLDKMKASLRK